MTVSVDAWLACGGRFLIREANSGKGLTRHDLVAERGRLLDVGEPELGAGRGSALSFGIAGAGAARPVMRSHRWLRRSIPSIEELLDRRERLLRGSAPALGHEGDHLWLSAIVPRLAFIWFGVSPPRAESEANRVLNSAVGEDEGAEPGVRCAGDGSG